MITIVISIIMPPQPETGVERFMHNMKKSPLPVSWGLHYIILDYIIPTGPENWAAFITYLNTTCLIQPQFIIIITIVIVIIIIITGPA